MDDKLKQEVEKSVQEADNRVGGIVRKYLKEHLWIDVSAQEGSAPTAPTMPATKLVNIKVSLDQDEHLPEGEGEVIELINKQIEI